LIYVNFYSSFHIFATAAVTLEGQGPSSTNNSTNEQTNMVFISYAREDYVAAGRLYEDLKRAGLTPWLDKESLIAGQNWKIAIKNAIKKSRYFIPIFSSNSVAKRGYVQKEFKYALEVLDEFPESEIFVTYNTLLLQNLLFSPFLCLSILQTLLICL
jgi:hypothetical protein